MTTIEAFDAATREEAVTLVAPCVAIPSFAEALADGRPYVDLPALLAAARELTESWSDDDVMTALADHPRIGQRHSGSGASAALSSAEQAGVDSGDDDIAARLAAGNAAYEERFGRIYLVRAAGRSAEELLEILDERLTNDPATELAVTKQQLGEIALLRLEGLFQ
ncbi:2-oxo-4-hydroxy-4-carboxy-5-ureidoimidazoline decarboxylase [Nocardioides sp. Kera G14]|uniref:2-oxo-4-hydroxy-4-carboxy-5-ureidoimidazoline decarboxylase n=1 Tax=Nocardioides sp. Kera G14 TaxID=2884264 RepID=UPI001D1130D3|nr:2-oxo-4-hydroxy-4-carboxy-5-ureidoimidazoline decarboxylase [Nocardioides sp. Kera G14]UDY22855.1 2-oxo-4-hydroxy-4-carboxy-5-ureidoimidazoline decarboxylase [Nocardioides sp. Kera G14]